MIATLNHRSSPRLSVSLLAAAGLAALTSLGAVQAADTDIYGPSAGGSVNPNVVFLLDNTSNWSSNNQGWNAGDSWTKCPAAPDTAVTACKTLIQSIYYPGATAATKFPWSSGYAANKDNIALTQGQVQLRALKLVLNSLVCSGSATALKVNVGLAMIGDSGSVLSNGHATGFIRSAVQPLTGTASTAGSSCKLLLDELDNIDSKITSPTFKAPSNANYGAAMYEIFKYFGGYTNPALASMSPPQAGAPVGASGYGPVRYSNINTLDDPAAFTDATRSTYKPPISAANACGTNFMVLVGNTYPNAEPSSNGGPTVFNNANLGYTPPSLSAVSSDTSRYADEWSQFLANTDVSPVDGTQRVFTYAINTYKDKPDANQAKLLKSMAAVGGVGAGGYLEVGGDLSALVDAFKQILANIAAVNSVFAATTLPVSTTTQGTYLNQIFVGMFRPDSQANPRWVGNLKQYEFGRTATGALDLVDTTGASAVLSGSGFFAPGAKSFWTQDSVFFANGPSGTPPSASDWPDGAIVEKGGVAESLRNANLQNSTARKVYTLKTNDSSGTALSSRPFSTANSDVTSYFSTDEINWARGENNVAGGLGGEEFSGSYKAGNVLTTLGATGARHSMHGDVLHSQPVALNYGAGKVIVYYGANDGTLRAVDGAKTAADSGTAGQELWSFVAPEHYSLLKRLRAGTPLLHLPETLSTGATVPAPDGYAPKQYGLDGPIGVFAAYASGGASANEAIIYPTMRRGGKVVYAIDVTTPTAPTLKWKITGGAGDYAKLAQTWSKPKAVIFPAAVSADPVIVMGGGYDPSEDTNGSSGIGNRVYAINGRTGALLKELATDFSVPSDVTVVDTNFDGVIDRAYVADVRGNLYRINMTDAAGVSVAPASWTITKIANIGGKVFFAPDVVATKSFVAVLVGTGDREKPLLVSTADNFVLIKDTLLGQADRAGLLGLTDLTRVASVTNAADDGWSLSNLNSGAVSNNGCYVQLATNGEKVVNAPFTIAGTTYFGTNRPKPAANVCSADLGIARSYRFPLFCSAPTATKIDGGGLPPSPVGGLVTLKVNGKNVLTPFLIGGGKDGSSFRPDEPRPPVSPKRTRQNWRIDNANR